MSRTNVIDQERIIDQNRVRTRRCAVALVVAIGTWIPGSAGAGPVEDAMHQCMTSGGGTADSIERRADHCQRIAADVAAAYHACMRDAPGSADSLERWVDVCVPSAEASRQGP